MYRSVADSGLFKIDEGETILVAPTQAGKTTILRALQQLAVAAILFASLLPSCVAALEAVGAGVVHDVGVPSSPGALGIATLPSSATLMVGMAWTGDGVSFAAPLVVRVEPDGTASSTRIGTAVPWLIEGVTDGVDDTLILSGATQSSQYFGRFDALGNMLWSQSLAAPYKYSNVRGDAAGVTTLETTPYFYATRLTRYGLDGSRIWQTMLDDITGCSPDCRPYSPVAMLVDASVGVVILGEVGAPASGLRLLEVSSGGTLLWQTDLDFVQGAKLARSADGRLVVFGSSNSSSLLLQVRERDGASAWDREIATAWSSWAPEVAFDDAGNVYTIHSSEGTATTNAFSATGDLRWTDAWSPTGLAGRAYLAVGSASQAVLVLTSLFSSDTVHGISQNGTPIFDTTLDQTSGQPRAWNRLADGSLVMLDRLRSNSQTMVLARIADDGGDVHYTIPGSAEVPTQARVDGVAWQADGEKTVLAYGAQSFVTRFAANGDVRWRIEVSSFGFAGAAGSDTLISTATYTPDIASTLQRVDANGTIVWKVTQAGACYDLAVREDGSSFQITYDSNDSSWTLDRHEASGTLAWSAPLSMVPFQTEGGVEAPRITPARDGGAFVHGRSQEGAMVVERYDGSGSRLWELGFGGLVVGYGESGLAEDERGSVFLAYDINAYPASGMATVVVETTAEGVLTWSTVLPQQTMSQAGRSLIAANDGGALLATSTGVHRVGADGAIAWSYADACGLGCLPQAIRQRDDGHVLALSSIALSADLQYGPRALRLVELDAAGNAVNSYVSNPRPQSQDRALDLRVDGANVDVAMQSLFADGLSRVLFLWLDGDSLFADGFDPHY